MRIGSYIGGIQTVLSEEAELAYQAAIIDGEGSIGINLRGNPNNPKTLDRCYVIPVVQVSNTFEPLCSYFRDVYGGRVWVNKDNRKNRKTIYLWSVASQRALTVIKSVYPFLWIKKAQADLVLEFYKDKANKYHIDDIEAARRKDIFNRAKILNMRGLAG